MIIEIKSTEDGKIILEIKPNIKKALEEIFHDQLQKITERIHNEGHKDLT